jgi:hypothetical protein
MKRSELEMFMLFKLDLVLVKDLFIKDKKNLIEFFKYQTGITE